MVCDIQGILTPDKFIFSDPVIHSPNGHEGNSSFGRTDRGKSGIKDFYDTHDCNILCTFLRLQRNTRTMDPSLLPLRSTSQFTVLKTNHLKNRQKERVIRTRELQQAVKYGEKQSHGDIVAFEHQGLRYVTDPSGRKGITGYRVGCFLLAPAKDVPVPKSLRHLKISKSLRQKNLQLRSWFSDLNLFVKPAKKASANAGSVILAQRRKKMSKLENFVVPGKKQSNARGFTMPRTGIPVPKSLRHLKISQNLRQKKRISRSWFTDLSTFLVPAKKASSSEDCVERLKQLSNAVDFIAGKRVKKQQNYKKQLSFKKQGKALGLEQPSKKKQTKNNKSHAASITNNNMYDNSWSSISLNGFQNITIEQPFLGVPQIMRMTTPGPVLNPLNAVMSSTYFSPYTPSNTAEMEGLPYYMINQFEGSSPDYKTGHLSDPVLKRKKRRQATTEDLDDPFLKPKRRYATAEDLGDPFLNRRRRQVTEPFDDPALRRRKRQATECFDDTFGDLVPERKRRQAALECFKRRSTPKDHDSDLEEGEIDEN